ncbi:hypothetical protein KAU18_05145 [Candidatus Bathyarchaeota archaeon]|nr:hypothetical protein [Candidatus Bathyarchaeota archaeon]
MDEITLQWEGPFTGSELQENIIGVHPDELLKDPKYSCLYWPGVYVFYREKQILYVGQANKSRGSRLRMRLKQHVINKTPFSERLRKNNIERDELLVIVAPFNKEQDYRVEKISTIENALMCPCKPPGHFDENLRITNLGNIGPLPNIIEIIF